MCYISPSQFSSLLLISSLKLPHLALMKQGWKLKIAPPCLDEIGLTCPTCKWDLLPRVCLALAPFIYI